MFDTRNLTFTSKSTIHLSKGKMSHYFIVLNFIFDTKDTNKSWYTLRNSVKNRGLDSKQLSYQQLVY
jgi:hypothetical protein